MTSKSSHITDARQELAELVRRKSEISVSFPKDSGVNSVETMNLFDFQPPGNPG